MKTNRTEALRYCQYSNINPTSTLVSIPDNTTNDYLTTLTKETSWTGGYKNSEGDWGWTDGSPWTFTKWAPGEPNDDGGREDFVEINFQKIGLWNDDPDVKFPKGALCQYDPTPHFSLEFEVRGKTDAHILLAPCPQCDGYEIVIGGWSNTQSAIRDGKQGGANQLLKGTPNILSPTEFRKFWIEIVEGDEIMISVGKNGEEEPFMATTFAKKHSILYAAFAAWRNFTNEWKVNIPEGKKS